MAKTEFDSLPPIPAAQVWDDALLANPHGVADKRRRVQKMFAAIAPSYDLNNRLHSLWRDQAWRRAAVKMADVHDGDTIVDVACGTGDLTLAFAKTGKTARITGVDFTFEMLPLARRKAEHQSITWLNGDAQALPLEDSSANVVSIAFGIRNVADPAATMREFHRILRPGGRLVILEFSLPTNPVLLWGYNLYFRKVLPRTATWISGDQTGAYKYLPESVNTFIGRETMVKMMSDSGFSDILQRTLTLGICICYRGIKK